MNSSAFDRKAFLLGSLGVAAGVGLAACSSGGGSSEPRPSEASSPAGSSPAATGTPPSPGPSTDRAQLPVYLPYQGVTPDLPGTAAGVDPAFRRMPADRPKCVPDVPGNGETISGMANIYYAVPPGPGKNSFWAGLNKRLGVDLKLTMVPNGQWDQKFATTIAGNDLPDLLEITSTPRLPQLLKAKFADLSEHLAGDAAKDYPNLANVPGSAWRWSIYNDRIYGVPIPRGVMHGGLFIRQDLAAAAGVSPQPESFAEFKETCRALTDPAKHRWAFCTVPAMGEQMLAAMADEPNGWRDVGGKLVNQLETDEHRQSVQALADLWQAGVIHPDSFGSKTPVPWFAGGTVAMTCGSYLTWTQLRQAGESTPGFAMAEIRAPKWEGGGLGSWRLGSGYFSITAVKQASPDRIKLALRVLNWLAAPFGTEEYFYRWYGQEGVDHTLDADGNPILTKTGNQNTVLPIRYLADSPSVLYEPGHPEDADVEHQYQMDEIPVGINDPTYGLYSATFTDKGAALADAFQEGTNDIIQGRKPLDHLDDLIKAWRSGGGEQMRREYQDQLQQVGTTATAS
jgi:putative aldouronate transport system substrate-binding protein